MHITLGYSGKNIVFEFYYSVKKHFVQVQVPTPYDLSQADEGKSSYLLHHNL